MHIIKLNFALKNMCVSACYVNGIIPPNSSALSNHFVHSFQANIAVEEYSLLVHPGVLSTFTSRSTANSHRLPLCFAAIVRHHSPLRVALGLRNHLHRSLLPSCYTSHPPLLLSMFQSFPQGPNLGPNGSSRRLAWSSSSLFCRSEFFLRACSFSA